MNKKTKSQKAELAELALGKGLSESDLDKFAPLPSPKRNMEGILKSLAKELKRLEFSGEELEDLVEHYIPKRIKEYMIEVKVEEYKNYYFYYSQKLAIATTKKEKDFYKKQIQEIKSKGFSIHHTKAIFHGEDAEKEKTLSIIDGKYIDVEKRLLGLA